MSEPYLSVTVEGQEVTDLIERVEVEESDSQADLATLVFGNSDLVLTDVLNEGLAVEIDLGYSDEHAVVFRGIVTAMRAYFPLKGQPKIEVQSADKLILMSMRPQTKRWGNTTVSQIVTEVAMNYGLLPDQVTIDDDPMIEANRPRQQVEETDLAFLNRLAQDYGCKLFVEHPEGPDTINFISTKSLLQADPVEVNLTFNDNVEEFSVSFDAFASELKERLVTTDTLTGDRIEVERDLVQNSDAQWTPDAGLIARLGAAAGRVAALLAKSAVKRASLTDYWRQPAREAGAPARSSADQSGASGDRARRMGQTGRGRSSGSVWLRPRKRVTIQGYGGRWSGDWYLATVRHELDMVRRRYSSDFVCTR